MALDIDRWPGQSVVIEGIGRIELIDVSDEGMGTLRFHMPKEVKIYREEVKHRIDAEKLRVDNDGSE